MGPTPDTLNVHEPPAVGSSDYETRHVPEFMRFFG